MSIGRLVTIEHFRDTYGVQVYLEPGEAVVYHAGFLIASVLETLHNGMDIAILDTSAACHMPDVLEMPYRPPLWLSGEPGEKAHTYRLGGPNLPGWGYHRGLLLRPAPAGRRPARL